MLKKCSFFLRIIIFFVILSFLIIETNYILTPKKYYEDAWPTTSTYKGFYQMQKNTVDVLFFGSSHAAACFNPQEIYNNCGIRSYNLACEQQSILVSYYWLKEAIKYQSPKIVILDTYMMFEFNQSEALNTSEPCTRMAIDAMKFSKVKYEAIKAICDNDKQQNLESYIFKNIRFHTRWTDLTEQDFTFKNLETHYELKGFAPLYRKGYKVENDYQPYFNYDTSVLSEPVPLMREYLDKIKKLCDENNIKLILVKTPTLRFDTSKHNYLTRYAKNNGIDFLDFNIKEIYDACDFVYPKDMNDNEHSNIWGAKKISLYLADILKKQYGIGSGDYCEQWADTDEYYQRILADYNLKYITDLHDYITALNQDRYTILISTQSDMLFCINDAVKKEFSRLGLDLNAKQNDSYYAAITDYDTVQQSGSKLLKYSGSTRKKLENFTIVSGGFNAGAQSSIKIGDTEYGKNLDGVNIVVYSQETRKVIDSVVYDGKLHR
ncbi:hypothetical protein SAMN05216249_10425 [Acetitomaculum ruminis DSM 5522]|uniref:SGNH/GDSL hydrolase family protein n=1 Tax=Acetitomaculum ruminis DSM 5522 TaxID=1120918 RepID=A0A1I0WDY5_9FIRM|nr:hypothetical protein [Acetitomaculum ruminis]SFA86932.1 hypothetical protein SAMN05216249_10425 [Acetitomaculum ruminis DSM 5522]